MGLCSAAPIVPDDWNLVGTAHITNGELRLTSATDDGTGPPPAGAAWVSEQLLVAGGFGATFEFRLSDQAGVPDPDDPDQRPGGDGFALVIQNSPAGHSAFGFGASGLGYMWIPNSVAVEFDTFQNAAWYGDPNGNHIAVNSRGGEPNMPHHLCEDGRFHDPELGYLDCRSSPTVAMISNPGFNLSDGLVHTVRLIYRQQMLSLFLDSMPDPQLSIPLSLDQLIDLSPTGRAYVGFTAGTRFSYQNHEILSWSFEPVPEPCTLFLVAFGMSALLVYRRKPWIRATDSRSVDKEVVNRDTHSR